MNNDFLQRHPFLRLLIPFAGGIVWGDAHYFGQRTHFVMGQEELSASFFGSVSPLLLGGIGLLFLWVAYFLSRQNRFRWLYGATVFALCFGWGMGLMEQRLHQTDFPFSGEADVYRAVIREKPEIKERSMLCRVGIENASGQEKLFLLYFPKDAAANNLRRGDKLWVHTLLAPPVNQGNPDEFDYTRYLIRKGGSGTGYIPTGHWRVAGRDTVRTFRQAALDCRERVVNLYRKLGFQKDELAVLSALTVGDKEELSDDIVETYSVSGASHVLALSGLHIGFIYALFLFLGAPLWRRWHFLKPWGLLITVLCLWAFAFLTGLSSSVVRSVVMFSLLALSSLQPEKPLSLNTLAATAFLMLLYNPSWLFDVGFQLSFMAVAAILLIQPKLYALLPVRRRIPRWIGGLLSVSVAAQIGAAPLVLFYFSRFSTHFLLTNLWVIPMVSLVMYATVLLLVLTPFPFLQSGIAWVVNLLVRVQNEGLRWIERLPGSSIEDVWIDVGEVFLFYLVILLLLHSFAVRTARSVYLSLLGCLFLVSCHAGSAIVHAPQRSIVFYNVSRCPAVHCLTAGEKSWLVCADSLPEITRLRRALSAHWNRQHLAAPQTVTADYSTSGLSFQNHILTYAGKRICLLNDSRWRYKTAARPLSIDYLYLSKGYRGGMEELTGLFDIHAVIVDSSLSSARCQQIEKECSLLGIPMTSLKEKGALCICL